jgi:outer membrane protein TolC
MHKYRPFLLLILISFALPACMTTDDVFGVKRFKKMSLAEFLTAEPSPVVISSEKKPLIKSIKSTSALVQAIMEAPSTARSIAVATATDAQVPVVESRKSSKIDITGSTGLSADPWPLKGNGVLGAANATITARQLLSDNGQTDRSILLSEMATKKALLEVEVAVDRTLKAVVQASDIKISSEKQIKIIDYYLNLYNAREELVLSAVQAGVLSKSDELELRSLRNNTLSDRTTAVLAVSSAESFLKTTLSQHYDRAMLDLATLHENNLSPNFSLEGSPSKKLLDLRSSQLALEIEIQKSQNKPTSSWQTSLSSPQSRGSNTTLYGGVTIGFPVADGGEAAAQIEAFTQELAVTKLDLRVLSEETVLAEKNWADFLQYYLLQKVLLQDRLEISKQSLEELELRLKAGRADVSKLAREILAKASAESALVQLEARYLSEKVTAQSSTGETCSLFFLCEIIANSLPLN